MALIRSDVYNALNDFGNHKIKRVLRQGHGKVFNGRLLLAMGCRETWLKNITGDYGHGRGIFQIDDRWHPQWLKSVRGCPSGTFTPIYNSALPKGRVPSLKSSIEKAQELLKENYGFGEGAGIPISILVKFSVASYNCGAGNALAGYRLGNIDTYTAHGDYSADIFNAVGYINQYIHKNNIRI